MTGQPITAGAPVGSTLSHAHHRHLRTAAAIAGVAALIAGGSYVATTTLGPDSIPTTGTDVNPSAQTLRELRESVAGQYGSHSAARHVVNPNAQTLSELRDSVAGQYGSQSAAPAVVNPQVLRQMRRSIAGQYGSRRAAGATVNPTAQVQHQLRESIAGLYGPAH
jgi:hypothetical protein